MQDHQYIHSTAEAEIRGRPETTKLVGLFGRVSGRVSARSSPTLASARWSWDGFRYLQHDVTRTAVQCSYVIHWLDEKQSPGNHSERSLSGNNSLPVATMPFKRTVEIGRVALCTYGPDAGKLYVIVDVLDSNRVRSTCWRWIALWVKGSRRREFRSLASTE